MNRADLISAFRTRADDVTEPQLWSDDEVALYLSEAEAEAAVRARLIKDGTTPAVTVIAVTASAQDYPLHESILDIDRAKLDSQQRPLERRTIAELDATCPGWESKTGTPRFFVEDNGHIRLVPQPAVADTLRLTVYRLPLEPLKAEDSEPEIHGKYHYRLIDWALRCAYMKPDSETLDKVKAGEYGALFDASFGIKRDANVERKQREAVPTIVKMHW